MDANDLARFIVKNSIEAELVFLSVETPTVEAAATAVGVTPSQIGKSLLFLVSGDPILVIANGLTRVDYKSLASYLKVSRKRLRLANASQVFEVTGYQVGTVPPFGHKIHLKTLVEEMVAEEEEIYAGGGAINALLRISTSELLRATKATSVKLRKTD
jgi:prolyl-tRNA editing enzyme YbaK/EbsC (Cys-tRNA(Pro) deacylase)